MTSSSCTVVIVVSNVPRATVAYFKT